MGRLWGCHAVGRWGMGGAGGQQHGPAGREQQRRPAGRGLRGCRGRRLEMVRAAQGEPGGTGPDENRDENREAAMVRERHRGSALTALIASSSTSGAVSADGPGIRRPFSSPLSLQKAVFARCGSSHLEDQ